MPRRFQGPRLWPQPAHKGKDDSTREAVWCIRDGKHKRSTGVRVEDSRRPPQLARDKLQAYLAESHKASRERGRAADEIAVADVIAIYLTDKAPRQARPAEVGQRARTLLEFWGDKRLSDVTGASCRRYLEHRQGRAVARRELEDLRAAIGHHRSEGLSREVVSVVLPDRGQPRDRWLTRSEAARLIRVAWRYREAQNRRGRNPFSRRHIARFILVALYTGTRAGAVCSARFGPSTETGWIDLDAGVFHRRAPGERETKKRKPPVRLPVRLLAHMRRWHANGQRYPVEWLGKPVKGVQKAFRRACEDAGLEGVSPHVLRHTAATIQMQNGTPIFEAAKWLGMTVETVERVYAHAHPDFQNEAAENATRKRKEG